MSLPLPPVTAPPEWTGTPEEWTAARGRIIAGQQQAVRSMPGPEFRAALAALDHDDRRAYRAAIEAAELRRIAARFPTKEK